VNRRTGRDSFPLHVAVDSPHKDTAEEGHRNAMAVAVGTTSRGGASSSSPPPTWRGFSSVDEYKAFLKDPARVVRLEWRKVALRKHRGFVSHSWLLAYLFDSRCLRLELFADTGLCEKMLLPGGDRAGGTLYDDRAAGAHDFVRPLTAQQLRQIAAEVSNLRPYSVTDWNCHHFVLNIWNNVVIEMLQCSHYPDRVKTGMLRSAIESIGGLVGGGAHLAAQLGIEEHETEVSESSLFFGSVSSMANEVTPVDEDNSTTRIRVLSWQQEDDRIYGELSVPGLQAWAADPPGQISRFTQALRRGSVLLLEPRGKPKVLVEAGSAARRPVKSTSKSGAGPGSRLCVDAWARAREWLPGDDGEVAMRLAAQIGLLDEVADIVQHAVSPTVDARASPRMASRTGAFTYLLGSTSFGLNEEGQLSDAPEATDDCSVVLRGSEVRLAMYIVLGKNRTLGCSGMQGRCPKQLWLLSGDARAGQEGSFTFVLQDIPHQDLPASAHGLALKELESLQAALATGDWGSQHRDAL